MSKLIESDKQSYDSIKEVSVSYIPSLGEIVKECRIKLELTQVDFAKLIDSNNAEVSRVESSITKKPSRKFLRNVSPYTGYSYTELLPIAGYSLTDEKKIYFNTKKQEIDYLGIVKDIYAADADLLDCFDKINEFATNEDITILKLFLKLIHETSDYDQDSRNNKCELFSKTKFFLTAHFKALLDS